MARLPQVTGKDFVHVLQKIGWTVHHQTGSHVVLKHEGPEGNPAKISILSRDTLGHTDGPPRPARRPFDSPTR